MPQIRFGISVNIGLVKSRPKLHYYSTSSNVVAPCLGKEGKQYNQYFMQGSQTLTQVLRSLLCTIEGIVAGATTAVIVVVGNGLNAL